MQKTLFLSLLAAISFSASAQNCADIPGFKRDLCVESKTLQGAVAEFQLGADFFYLKTPHLSQFTKVPTQPNNQDLTTYLYQLANQNDKSLNAVDMVFIIEATNAFQAYVIETRNKAFAEYVKGVTANKRTTENLATLATVNKTASGLGYQMISTGPGPRAQVGKKVKVHYRGYLPNGNVFDSSFDRGQPFEFILGQGQVIKGWDEGIGNLNLGDHAILRIPPALGYGARAVGSIPANSELIFEVILMGVE